MKPQYLLTAGIVLGLVAVVLLNFYVRARIGAIQKKAEAIELLTAKKNISAGKTLGRDQVVKAKVPAEYATALGDAIKPADLALVEGKVLKRRAYKGQFLLWSMFEEGADKGRPDSLEKILPAGLRLVAVPVTMAGTARGWVRPGDLVDLAATFKTGGVEETWVVLEKVKVVATGGLTAYSDSGRAESRSYGDITVQLSPADALKAVHAIDNASRIQVLLRNPEDKKPLADEERGISKASFDAMRPRQLITDGQGKPRAGQVEAWVPPPIGAGPTAHTTR